MTDLSPEPYLVGQFPCGRWEVWLVGGVFLRVVPTLVDDDPAHVKTATAALRHCELHGVCPGCGAPGVGNPHTGLWFDHAPRCVTTQITAAGGGP